MKRQLSFLLTLLALMWLGMASTFAQCFTMSGAGTAEINGEYTYTGTNVSGYDYYTHSSGFYYISELFGNWYVCNDPNDIFSGTVYYNTYDITESIPPYELPWGNDGSLSGAFPVPTGAAGCLTCPSAPNTAASGLSFQMESATSATINLVAGSGTDRMVILKEAASIDLSGINDGTAYNADSDFLGSGDPIDGGKVVYAGTGSSVTVTNLTSGQTYYVAVVEYNSEAGCDNKYLTSGAAADTLSMFSYTSSMLYCTSGEIIRSLYQQPQSDIVPGASEMVYRIYSDIGLSNLFATYEGGDVLDIDSVAPSLQWNTSYYVTVAARFDATTGVFGSTGCKLTIIPDPAGIVAAPSLSVYHNTYRSLSEPIRPTIVSGANEYYFEVYDAGGITMIGAKTSQHVSDRTLRMNMIPGVTAGTNYLVRVRALIGLDMSPWSSTAYVKVLPDNLGTSTLTPRFCNESVSEFQNIKANTATLANRYTFALYSDPACTNLVDSVRVNHAYLNIGNSLPALAKAVYYVKVRPSLLYHPDTWVYGDFGSACTIQYQDFASVAPTRLNGVFRAPATVTASSNISTMPVAGANSYTFAFYSDSTASNLVATYTTNNTNQLFLSSTSLGSGTYYVRVKAAIGSTQGNYDAIDQMIIASSATRMEKPSEETPLFTAYPNPSKGNITVSYQSEDNEPSELVIYRNDIELMRQGFEGSFERQVDLSGSDGLYIIRVISAKGISTQKVIVVR